MQGTTTAPAIESSVVIASDIYIFDEAWERHMNENVRTRTFSWQDPLIAAEASRNMSGMDYLLSVIRGELPMPPIMATLGLDQITPQGEPGKITFFLDAKEFHYNGTGSVHGGVISTLLDFTIGCTVQSMLPAGVSYITLELKVTFLRPLTKYTGVVRCEGAVLSLGTRGATAEGRMLDDKGKLYAHATATCLILQPAAQLT
jgi:uncharacterized protein (TIGR00369 family)